MIRKTVSVAMAAYNGEKYIRLQVESVLKQLLPCDELVVSLDPSADQTEAILRSFQDERIKIIPGLGQGAIKNFEHAISHCENEIIFLCDQDDIWMSNKVERVLKEFDDSSVQVVLHDASVFKDDGSIIIDSFFKHRSTQIGIVHNIMKNGYLGCCMAFRKSLTKVILPFPSKIPMHDMWIGIMAETQGKNQLVHEKLIQYRRHEDNVTSLEHAGMFQMISWRLDLIKAILTRKKELRH